MRITTTYVALFHAALMLPTIGSAQATALPATNTPQAISPASVAVAQPQSDTPHTTSVFWISSVEVMRSTHAPLLDVIRVRGLASTEGWESAELIPLTKGVPADGFLDLVLVAEAPADSTAPSAFVNVEALFTIEPGHPFKGVRVHGAENRVTVKSFPGYTEAPTHPLDCSSCVGKYFVRKGETSAATRAQNAIVHEEDLPHNLHVIRETEGVGSLSSDPNRLTILLNAEGQIVAAMWD
jgi:hypothetical protein